MGFYSQTIAPRLLDFAMSRPSLAPYRQAVLADVEGEVLEIGFGTGINLSYYPESLEKLLTVDVNPGMNDLAKKRIDASRITVDHRVLSGESLPMADHTFDTVVSTWTLCSIEKIEQALQEIHRVLKPGGKFLFIEHGLSEDPKVQVWQHRLNPINKVVADGCQINRNIRAFIEAVFSQVEIKEFYLPNTPKIGGYMYKGIATKI